MLLSMTSFGERTNTFDHDKNFQINSLKKFNSGICMCVFECR